MAFWNCHALEGHASETMDGSFISPVSGDIWVLSWSERKIAESILRRYYASKDLPWGDRAGHRITRRLVSEWVGKPISHKLWADAMNGLEGAGLFSIVRERGEGHKITIGRLLRCDLNECQNAEHYPADYPLPKVSPPFAEVRTEVSLGEETPNVSRDTNNLNNSPITSNRNLEIFGVGSALSDQACGRFEPHTSPPNLSVQTFREVLPSRWQEWLYLRAGLKGHSEPMGVDMGHALYAFNETGMDLEPEGAWLSGVAYPWPMATG